MKLYTIIVLDQTKTIHMDKVDFACKAYVYSSYTCSDKDLMEARLKQSQEAWKLIPFKLVEFEL